MKKKHIFWCVVVSALVPGGCKTEIPTYDGDQAIYFAMTTSGGSEDDSARDYTSESILPFAMTASTDSTFIVRVKTMGPVAGHDRRFAVVVDQDGSDAIPGTDYEALAATYTLEAGEIYGKIPIVFHRTASLKDNERTLRISLVANEEFTLSFPEWRESSSNTVDIIRHSITVSDKFVQLPGFSVYYFGPFSEKKMRLMMELFNLKMSDFNKPFEFVLRETLGENLHRYLKRMDAQGQTVYEDYRDENGNPVKMTSGAMFQNQ